ncbi:MAG: hypothetical protein R3C52_10815 [Hyphomonadaceae bacterium]
MRTVTVLGAALAVLYLPTVATAQEAPQTATPDTASAQEDSQAPRLLPSAAAAYAEYQTEVTEIRKTPLANAKQVDSALTSFGARNADQLSTGWMSYSALVAARNSQFADEVKNIEGFYGRDRVVTGMKNDIGYARTLKGGEDALQMALAVNDRDSSRISDAAAYVKGQSYKLADISWAKKRVASPTKRANQLKLSAQTAQPIAEAAQKFFDTADLDLVLAHAESTASESSVWDKVSLLTASAPTAALSALTPSSVKAAPAAMKVLTKRESTANRMVTLAALQIMEAASTNPNEVKAAMHDAATTECIGDAQLQLQACVSTAKDPYEQSFCLAQHALGDGSDNRVLSTGRCFAEISR